MLTQHFDDPLLFALPFDLVAVRTQNFGEYPRANVLAFSDRFLAEKACTRLLQQGSPCAAHEYFIGNSVPATTYEETEIEESTACGTLNKKSLECLRNTVHIVKHDQKFLQRMSLKRIYLRAYNVNSDVN